MEKQELKPATILLVEDNRMDIELTLNAFEEARLSNEVKVVRTGQKAIDYLLGNNEYSNRKMYPLPDLILLDIKLPGIDGHEVLATIKKDTGYKAYTGNHIVIIKGTFGSRSRVRRLYKQLFSEAGKFRGISKSGSAN